MNTTEQNSATTSTTIARRAAGSSLIGIAFLLILAMLHHPIPHGHSFDEFVQDVKAINLVNQVVHGSTIAMIIAMLVSLSYLAELIGIRRFSIRLAMATTYCGSFAMIIAATVSGFIVPAYLEGVELDSTFSLGIAQSSTSLLRKINQCFDLLGVASLSAGVFLFSTAVLFDRQKFWMLGLLGIVVGATGIAGLFLGFTDASVSGIQVFAILLGAWLTTAGTRLIASSKKTETVVG